MNKVNFNKPTSALNSANFGQILTAGRSADHAVRVQVRLLVLSEGLRPSDSPTRSLARRFAGALRSRGSLAVLARDARRPIKIVRCTLVQRNEMGVLVCGKPAARSEAPRVTAIMKKQSAFTAVAMVLLSASTHGQKDWLYYGQDQGASRYSTLSQISTSNIATLKRAWTFHTGDKSGFFESTPIVVDSVMYFAAGNGFYAFDAVTGAQIWKVDATAHHAARRVVLAWGRADPAEDHRIGGHQAHGARREDRQAVTGLRQRRGRRARGLHELAGGDLQGSRHRPGQQGVDPRVEHPYGHVGLDVQPDRSAWRSRTRDLGAGELEGSGRHECLGLPLARRVTRPRVPAQLDARIQRLLRRDPAWRQPVRNFGGCSRRRHRQAAMVSPARPPRHLGLRSGRRAGAGGRGEERQDDSRRCADHEDGAAVRARSHDRRAGVGHRGAPGAAEHRSRREDGADAAVPRQARAPRPQFHDESGPRDNHARARGVLQGPLGEVRAPGLGAVHAVERQARHRALSWSRWRRQLERGRREPAARPDDHERHERRAVGASRAGDGTWAARR